jgi:adenosine deaminase
MFTDSLIRALPKTDLHVHLDGSLREQSLIELARERGVKLPSQTVEGLNELVFKSTYESLPEYLTGFAYTCAVLQDEESLERAAYELAWDNINEGVRYIEVRFAPQLHMHKSMRFDDVLLAVNKGLKKAETEHLASNAVAVDGEPPFKYGIIVCALRYFNEDFSRWYAQLCSLFEGSPADEVFSLASLELARASTYCRDHLGVPIVGFDLAGQEDGFPAQNHQRAYDHAHTHFLKKTVHAGEAYGPESIFQAITDLHADRIGHGYHLFSTELCGSEVKDPDAYVKKLARYIADRRITIEVCITSNLQTNPSIESVDTHIFRRMLDEKFSATLCTDNRLVSHTTVSREYRLALDHFGMNAKQLRNTIIYGFKRSFFPGPYGEKRAYVRQIIDFYDRIISEHTG